MSTIMVGLTKVDLTVMARIVSAARFSLAQAKKAEGSAFPTLDKAALETLLLIDFDNDLWRM